MNWILIRSWYSKFKTFVCVFQEDQDWGIVAMVLDRLFLWVFGICAFFGSLMILSDSPYIYEEFTPIDVKFSKIAEEESRMYEQALYWTGGKYSSMNKNHRYLCLLVKSLITEMCNNIEKILTELFVLKSDFKLKSNHILIEEL